MKKPLREENEGTEKVEEQRKQKKAVECSKSAAFLVE